MISPATYLRTIRHLRREQLVARLWRLVPKVPIRDRPAPPVRTPQESFGAFIRRPGPIRRGSCFRFLNRSGKIVTSADWDRSEQSKLWIYNLHYFEWLREAIASERVADDAAWLDRWISENPVGRGSGWEPYPISLRTVNWIVWFLSFGRGTRMHYDSLATQVRHLVRSIEYHLYGNHLLANAKALICAGTFFEGPEADTWRALGLDLLGGEIREQILADGAHFELSPMYHSLILEDILDLLGFSRTYPAVLAEPIASIELTKVAARMAQWLADIQHPDGQIPYFNDAVFGIASPPAEILAYAGQRGIFVNRSMGLTVRQPSGYAVLSKPPFHVIFDCGRIGPDYLPGHAHADTLSFELSARGERLVSNSGVSTYAPGHEREWERSTRAHATVEVDGCNSAETWASFRVGRRPNVGPVECGTNGSLDWVECWHDGYRHLPGSPIHRRRVTVTSEDVRISDRIEGSGVHDVRGFLPLHPRATAERLAAGSFRLTTAGRQPFEVAIRGPIETTLQTGQFALGFGMMVPRPLIEWRWRGTLPLAVETRLAVAVMPHQI